MLDGPHTAKRTGDYITALELESYEQPYFVPSDFHLFGLAKKHLALQETRKIRPHEESCHLLALDT